MSVHLDGISKRYGGVAVLSGITLQVEPGERVLLLGRNGAGKSTLLRICAGLMRPDQGEVLIENAPISASLRQQVGYGGHLPLLYAELSVRENLALFAKLSGTSASVAGCLEEWSMNEFASKKVSQLSKGQQARVALCRALIHQPRFIFLDEPSSALDDSSTEILLSHLQKRNESVMIIASHDLSRLGQCCSRVVLLDAGDLVADSQSGMAPQDIMEQYRRRNR